MKTQFQIGPMSMKNNNLAVHHIKIRKDNHIPMIDRQNGGGLDSPFTLSEDGMPEGNYDDYSEQSYKYSKHKYNKSNFKT